MSRNTRLNCNFPLPFKNLPLKLHLTETPLLKLLRNSLYQVLNISYFSHFTLNILGKKCMGFEAALAWKTCFFGLTKKLPCTDRFIYKTLLDLLRSLEVFLFQMNRYNSAQTGKLREFEKLSQSQGNFNFCGKT